MPWVEYNCQNCGHEFKRLVMRGEKSPLPPCPRCETEGVTPVKSSEPLFEGISNFSEFGKDVN